MAGPNICYSPQNKLFSIGKNELTKYASGARTNSSGIFCPTPAAFYAPTSTLALGLSDIHIDMDLQIANRLGLELFIKGQEYS